MVGRARYFFKLKAIPGLKGFVQGTNKTDILRLVGNENCHKVDNTYFFPNTCIPYKTPVPPIMAAPTKLLNVGQRKTGGNASLKLIIE